MTAAAWLQSAAWLSRPVIAAHNEGTVGVALHNMETFIQQAGSIISDNGNTLTISTYTFNHYTWHTTTQGGVGVWHVYTVHHSRYAHSCAAAGWLASAYSL